MGHSCDIRVRVEKESNKFAPVLLSWTSVDWVWRSLERFETQASRIATRYVSDSLSLFFFSFQETTWNDCLIFADMKTILITTVQQRCWESLTLLLRCIDFVCVFLFMTFESVIAKRWDSSTPISRTPRSALSARSTSVPALSRAPTPSSWTSSAPHASPSPPSTATPPTRCPATVAPPSLPAPPAARPSSPTAAPSARSLSSKVLTSRFHFAVGTIMRC
jgi:hypothetical protein